MTVLIYLDSNIYIDYLENRSDGLRPLGDFAFNVLKRAFNCEFSIVLSSLVVEELANNNVEKYAQNLIMHLSELNKLVRVESTKEELKLARKICRERATCFNDTLHAIIANRANAEFFVTRNIKDFVKLQDFVKIIVPESL